MILVQRLCELEQRLVTDACFIGAQLDAMLKWRNRVTHCVTSAASFTFLVPHVTAQVIIICSWGASMGRAACVVWPAF